MPKILVVEDEGVVALDICQELTALGYEVIGQVPSGEEAIESANRQRPDLVFMDINLQGRMDGIEAASILCTRGIGIIFLTAHADEATLRRAKITQPFGYIIKPFETDELRVAAELGFARLHTGATEKPASDETIDAVPSDLDTVDGRVALLARLPLFAGLPVEQLGTLGFAATPAIIGAGEQVWMEGDDLQSAIVVIAGRLAVLKTNTDGKELVMELLSNMDDSGILLACGSKASYYSVRAQTETRALLLPITTLRSFLQANPFAYERIVERLAERAERFSEFALNLAHAKVERRIVATLLTLARQIGRSSKDKTESRIFLTRKELADLTGTTPETAIRVTKAMEREGILDLTRPGIIKIPSLTALAEMH